MCAVFRRDRPVIASLVADEPLDTHVTWLPDEGDWAVDAPCDACGGYRMLLQVRDAASGELASTRAGAFLARIHARGGCLGCEARGWREDPRPRGSDAQVWWDTETGQWMVWTHIPGFEHGASLPLGINTFWAPQEVRAAARAISSGGRLPLRIATRPEEVDDGASTIYYDTGSGRWRLHLACLECGGFELPLTSFGRGAVEAACDEALACLELVAREGCPCCRTETERNANRGEDDEPRIWFDTLSRDWLVWQPLDGADGGVTLPLGIGRYDARRPLVYRAAAGLLFDSQLFLDEGL
ncbi:MAG: hypothetical protein QOF37_1901 [Thermoleophilaceae bacterium]|jgi:hypothetical protein|nr:hypothetical protein [Thermoleophilaceae bacterium]